MCALTCSSVYECACSDLPLSSAPLFLCCAALILCLLLVSAPQSYSQWDSTDLPLCEAYRRRDSWASPGSSCSSTQGDREDVEGPPSQETNPQHHLNGHGASSIEKPWGEEWTLIGTHAQSVLKWFGSFSFHYTLWTSVGLDLPL